MPSSEPTIDDAIALHAAGRLADAEPIYRAILQREPDHAGCLHRLGVICFQRGEHAGALALIDAAVAKTPNDAALHNNRGIVLKHMNRLDEAIASYDRAIALAPDDAEAFNNRGVAFADVERFDEALASYDSAVAQARPRGGAQQSRQRPGRARTVRRGAGKLRPPLRFSRILPKRM
jgi:tetratricopeptide (TPR) repeat protein